MVIHVAYLAAFFMCTLLYCGSYHDAWCVRRVPPARPGQGAGKQVQVCLTAVGAQVQKSISHLECPKVRVFFQVCLCRGGSHFSGATLKVQGQAGCVELNKRVCLWGCCRRG